MSHDRKERQRPRDPDEKPESHLDGELGDDDGEVLVVVRRELDHPDHERDAHGIVHPGFALEDRAGATPDLARAEDRERHRRVGGRDCGADEPGEDPVEPEDVVGCDRDEPGGRERAEHTDGQDRPERLPEAAVADVEPAVEEDDDQRDDRDALDVQDRQLVLQRVRRLGERHRTDEDHGRIGEREAVREAHAEQRGEHDRRHHEDDQPEVRDLRHRQSWNLRRAQVVGPANLR